MFSEITKRGKKQSELAIRTGATPKHISTIINGTKEISVSFARKLEDRERFEEGLRELVRRLHPHTIIVYGSANYPCFKELEKQGIKILAYPGKTSRVFAGRAKK